MTGAAPEAHSDDDISIHIPRVGDDAMTLRVTAICNLFQSTSPVWGMTVGDNFLGIAVKISIHIPRVGDDHQFLILGGFILDFNPHPPCGG